MREYKHALVFELVKLEKNGMLLLACKDEKGEELVWVPSASEWRKNEHFVDKDTGKKCYRDAVDNTIYEWDEGKSAWFPLIDEDFLAVYQMQYGIANEDEEKVEEKAKDEEPEKQEEKPTKKRKPENPTWFQIEAEKNTNVYVQGLPLDITEEEFVTTMSKCGLVAKDPDSGKMKVKLYLNKDGKVKGDGRCCYIRRESVDLALQILDGYNLRGFNLKVEPAEFTQKGEYDPTKKPRKKRKQEKEKLKKMQEKLLAWKPDELRGQRPRSDKVVIMKNLFDPETFKKDPKLILDVQTQLKSECEKFGGAKKVVLHDRHPDGVAEVVFKEFENSDLCVQIMNRRLFGDRRLIAELWDGKTKYRIEETEEERKERLGQWEKFLESDE
ncbi:unnamed protein product [Notodromas monacha]|uniref:17S U2 SnRNP complex component HTATSF1 n=1 Tax=Notodromas monacha TaxID=399045 RepID=A0A7R9BZ29_9CRUS|nr:unnamed protein product [Notodromas monacha]CAG0923473.1 unnamed protein product [Notodromas monacha]